MRKLLIFLFLLLPVSALAAVPQISSRVTDLAHMLSPDTKTRIEQKLEQLEQSDSTQIVVLTVPSLEGIPIETYSMTVAEQARIGQKKLDNGALLLIAKNDHKLRIEVGYGLEGKLTDLLSGRIIRGIITPEFRQGNFNKGIEDGVDAMIAAVKGEFSAEDIPQTDRQSDNLFSFVVFIITMFLAFGSLLRRSPKIGGIFGAIACPLVSYFFFGMQMPMTMMLVPGGFFLGYIASLMLASTFSGGSTRRYTNYRGPWNGPGSFGGGGFGGGGGFSGGGGGFGGGGASGGW